jgi:hypothetical protein
MTIKYKIHLIENKLVATDYKDVTTVVVPHRILMGGERHEFTVAPGDIIITGVIPEDEPHTLALRISRIQAIEGEWATAQEVGHMYVPTQAVPALIRVLAHFLE